MGHRGSATTTPCRPAGLLMRIGVQPNGLVPFRSVTDQGEA
jgi:hypothetical protein